MSTNANDNIDVAPDTRFGACPECGRHDGYVNLGANHVFVCSTHKTAWCVGSNLFSSWEEETPEQRAETERMLKGYRDVEPIYPPGSRP